ncbi:hypothetical protein DL764_001429 [Monosporascus ibericus]|uniref:Uncharacterized protein n=1 Tax=Monosporascus ibericus TaxID=155417 RepID=A0A4Q4TR44_9PEZI|nr:hypothetical protein DL764_001429 [Monosporascus ibericus]
MTRAAAATDPAELSDPYGRAHSTDGPRELKELAIVQHGYEKESQCCHSSSSLRDLIATRTLADGNGTERAAKRQKKGRDAEKPAQTSDKGGKKDDKGEREEKPKKEDKATILKLFDADLDHYFKDNAEKETPSATASKQGAKASVVKDARDEETNKAPVEKRKVGPE